MTKTEELRLLLELRGRIERLEAVLGARGELPPMRPIHVEVPPDLRRAEEIELPKVKERPMQTYEVDPTLIGYMSHSEIVQVCRDAGYPNASKQIPQEDLVSLLFGESDCVPEDPLEEVRRRTYNFVNGNKRMLISTMRCDLNCPACPHNRVVECYTENHDIVDNHKET